MNIKKNIFSVFILTSLILLSLNSSDRVIQPSLAVNYENTWTHKLIHTKDAWEITKGSKDI
ncbi:MAG: hypothetical protein KAJ30_04520, partial [Candidatus Heimdallarchaeota archaeon]|nr:hypothetical protein [Candidatus Heimdallarchaeota archaeon]